jgi:peptide/nickel transport system permease protein
MSRVKKILLMPFTLLFKIVKMNKKTMIGISILATFTTIAILEPIINYFRLNGKSPLDIGIYPGFLYPSLAIPLGTDPYGRDLFGLLLMGTRFTLVIGTLAGLLEILIAIPIGFFAGYRGGLADHSLRSITEALLVIPTFPIVIFLAMYLKSRMDIFILSLLIGVFGWPGVTLLIRSQVLSIKERSYVELAKMSGAGDLEIIFKEILPNMLPYMGVGLADAILGAMLTETGYRVLIGTGPINLPTLGYLVNLVISSGFLTTRQYALLPPILFLILIFISLHLVNMGLDETYNPRLKKITGQ